MMYLPTCAGDVPYEDGIVGVVLYYAYEPSHSYMIVLPYPGV